MGQVVSLVKMVVQHILPYFIKNVPISSTLWISSSIHYITLEREYKGSSSGGPHREPTKGSQTIEGQLGYGHKYDETTSIYQPHSEREIEVGDWVFLRIQPYKQMSL
jgi:hypothetical protein